MEPQKTDSFDTASLPDLRQEWSGVATKEIWGPQEASTRDFDNGSFLVHKGAKLVAGEGALVGTDNEEKPEPPPVYETQIINSYFFFDGILIPTTKEVTALVPPPPKPYFRSAEVEARAGSKVLAKEGHVSARAGSYVQGLDNSYVEAFEGSTVRAQEGSHVNARLGSRVLAENRSVVTARGGSRVVGLEGCNITAEPGSQVELREGAVAFLNKRPLAAEVDDSRNVDLKAAKGSFVVVQDAYAKLDPAIEAEVRFTGNKKDWLEFRKRNPELNLVEPDYTSMSDLINGSKTWNENGMLYSGEPQPQRVVAPPRRLPQSSGASFAADILDDKRQQPPHPNRGNRNIVQEPPAPGQIFRRGD